MSRLSIPILSLIAGVAPLSAQSVPTDVEYTREDSLEVVSLLSDNNLRTPIDFARRLCGRPYVAHTLERGEEHLVVNLRGLDCATLVESASALSMARLGMRHAVRAERPGATGTTGDARAKVGRDPWKTFCRALESIRYRDGRCNGYLSRLHYLTFWIDDHLKRGDVVEVALPDSFTQKRRTDIHYMSRHAAKYPGLKGTDDVRSIAEMENRFCGKPFFYLPQAECGRSKAELGAIRDGDIVCIVTTLDGLDYSHQGLAFWGTDGKLHLLHASSTKGKVIADTRPLDVYLKGIKSSIGIRVFRLRASEGNVRQVRPRTHDNRVGK